MSGWLLAAYSAGLVLLGLTLGGAGVVLVLGYLADWLVRRQGWR